MNDPEALLRDIDEGSLTVSELVIAVEFLGMVNSPNAARVAVEMLQHADPRVRLGTCNGLSAARFCSNDPALRDSLRSLSRDDSDERVRIAATDALIASQTGEE